MQHYYDIIDALPRSKYCPDFPWRLGNTVYFRLGKHFVVDAKINELELVLTHPRYDGRKESLWFYLYDPTLCPSDTEVFHNFLVPIPGEKDKLGWPKYEQGSLEFLQECTLANWFVCIDLPVGHALGIDTVDPYDCYPDLSTAIRDVAPIKCRSRVAKSVLHCYLKRGQAFIAMTHNKPVPTMGFPRYRRWGEREVYWKRK